MIKYGKSAPFGVQKGHVVLYGAMQSAFDQDDLYFGVDEVCNLKVLLSGARCSP